MPYAGYSYRGVRGRTFGCANGHEDSPNYFGIKNAHDIEGYAIKSDRLIEDLFDTYGEIPQWLENDISVIRQQVGDVKHFLEFEHGRNYGHGPTGMVHENLHIIAKYSHFICSALKEIDHPMPGWAKDKLGKARQIMADVYHYMEYHLSDDGRQYGHPVSGVAFMSYPANTRSKKRRKTRARPARTSARAGSSIPHPGDPRCVKDAGGLDCGGDTHKCRQFKDALGHSTGQCCWCEDGGGGIYVNKVR